MIKSICVNKFIITTGIFVLCSLIFTINAKKSITSMPQYNSLDILNEKEQRSTINIMNDKSEIQKWSSRMLQEESEENPDEMSYSEASTDNEPKGLQLTLAGIGYSFMFIFLSEIGDKTFLFIILYATKMNPIKLLIVSSLGICTMHILGVLVGDIFQYFLSPSWVKLITVVSFFIFGVILIYTGIRAEHENEDLDTKLKEIEVEMISKRNKLVYEKNEEEEVLSTEDAELNIKDTLNINESSTPQKNMNLKRSSNPAKEEKIGTLRSFTEAILFSECVKVIFTIFLTEMGDRSQISAVGLAAVYNFWIVAIAGSVGHICAMFCAIVFGRVISSYTSEKCTNIAGGILFLIFSAYSIVVYYILNQQDE